MWCQVFAGTIKMKFYRSVSEFFLIFNVKSGYEEFENERITVLDSLSKSWSRVPDPSFMGWRLPRLDGKRAADFFVLDGVTALTLREPGRRERPDD